MTGTLQTKASRKKDEPTTLLIRRMMVVPREVRESVLLAYINKCRQRHNVAFLQWRYRFPNEHTFVKEDLETLI